MEPAHEQVSPLAHVAGVDRGTDDHVHGGNYRRTVLDLRHDRPHRTTELALADGLIAAVEEAGALGDDAREMIDARGLDSCPA